ncbi:uncharacterized protein ACLA_068640 [Aspergillus clavatus NRRL 1]|uniref:Uncharacterized protein n=1 Tax=Aspergillus clavatus (strain ATCC 1007 / CBS 513.65 / DSM 816 / NCTC 3887 / NRRL 1 / QM 1276 / 107) TaxID=344612 RepID=A1C615_ASPCL|nr:uncharacterized protein ACLA_068640 [Aspergillus clavatus NRRL 1]EAW13836.1 conserved hypothetical protein [Aspergillus clavatus NRRL 1]
MTDQIDIKQVSEMLCDAFDNVMANKTGGLTESVHAPKADSKTRTTRSAQSYYLTPINKPPPTSSSTHIDTPAHINPVKPTRSQGNTPSKDHRSFNSNTPSKMAEISKDFPVANVDDAAGFMAFARALREKQALEAAAAGKTQTADGSGQQNENNDAWGAFSGGEPTTNEPVLASGPNDAWPTDSDSGKNNGIGDDSENKHSLSMPGQGEGPETPKSSCSALNGGVSEFVPRGNAAAAPQDAHAATATGGSDSTIVEEEEDRENLATFKTWGTPVTRGKPTAQVRRVIIKGLPASWATPAKVLSLIHGGMIESISISSSGNAHILFCDHEACQAFYDKYPNGIDLDKEKRKTVFVEMGTEVDVISSQLSFNLSIGSTRVVRAIGVDMSITMAQLLKLATNNNRKVEKILDSCVPGDARNVVFRFCTIDDAVKFRAAIIRDADWEHCNIQHAADPCELATGFHAD